MEEWNMKNIVKNICMCEWTIRYLIGCITLLITLYWVIQVLKWAPLYQLYKPMFWSMFVPQI